MPGLRPAWGAPVRTTKELAFAALVGIVAGLLLAWGYGLPGAL